MERLLFEMSKEGKSAYSIPPLDVDDIEVEKVIPKNILRSKKIGLPSLSEVDISRHYTRLSRMNYGVDVGIYPLGSCTMKYNPKLGEDISRMGGFTSLHPFLPERAVQGALAVMYELGEALKKITGMDAITLQPAAGAHGELTGMLIIRAYHNSKGRRPTLHNVDALLYYDGANLNAIMGKTNPGLMGCDIVHLNLHKTFATPHGGGGPGSGPVCVTERLREFLPVPIVERDGDGFRFDYDLKNTIGKVGSFFGNFGVFLKALAYILSMGDEGIKRVSEDAVLNANYLRKRLTGVYDIPYNYVCMHEFVASGRNLEKYGVRTVDVAKRLIDYGMHPPTVYFPLIVDEALMIEPTETEGLDSLEAFADALIKIAEEAKENPDILHNAPINAPVGRLDETKAAKELDVVYTEDVGCD